MATEFDIIARYFRPLAADEPGAFGLTDDGAVIDVPPGRRLVITTDTMVEGVHYLPSDPPETVGRKLLAVNLSDLAAMGAAPLDYSLSLALPAAWGDQPRDDWLCGFSAGLGAMQRTFGIRLSGGDLVAIPGPACLTVTALGTVAPGAALRRQGACPGDAVWVTGTIGDAALGLRVLQGRLVVAAGMDPAGLIARYRTPEPRLKVGARLAGLARAVADVSDGLVADLAHICSASGVTARVDVARIPLSPVARALVSGNEALLAAIVGGGDDYELVFTTAPGRAREVDQLSQDTGVAVTRIGSIGGPADRADQGGAAVFLEGAEFVLTTTGYTHF